jgi:gamma-glutamyl-gamma-aminobutyrate hydrolase PuuD/predicted ATP-grasp superfamily ATP-dependent carboligase
MGKGRAIVTYGRSLMALVIARSLHERGIEVIGCDDVGLTVLSFSRHVAKTFVHSPFDIDEAKALDEFEEAVRRFAPPEGESYVLMPAFRDARIFAKYRDRFEPLIKVAAPDWDSIQMVDPKDNFARFLQEQGLPGPVTRIIAPFEHRQQPPANVTPPLVAKPVDGVGGRGVKIVATQEELGNYLAAAPPEKPILLQEVIAGYDYCLSFVAVRGQVLGAVCYRNLSQFPIKAGAGATRETVDAEPFMAATRALVRATKWNGVAEIDFRWSGRGEHEPKMLEVNPRYWAGLYHSTASGIDFPWLAYQVAAGLPIKNPKDDAVEIGLRTRTPGAWILAAAQEVAASDPHLKRAAAAWSSCKDSVSQGELLRALKRFSETTSRSMRGAKALKALRRRLEDDKDLTSELNSDHDPAVGLGVLFALSSLIRHGKLPPEFKFSTKEEGRPAKRSPAPDRTNRPVIGITKPDAGDWLAYQAMRLAIALAGGRAIKITTRAPRDPKSIDGLLFGGGSDVFPKRYAGEPKQGYRYDLARDDMEASWAEAALKHDIPVLGVCRGMQMLNVLGGGTLFADLRAFKRRNYPATFLQRIFYRLPIRVAPASWLAEATQCPELCVNSIHSQAVDKLGVGFHATAWDIDGPVQAIEHMRSTFLLGVQFHPEFLLHRSFARRLFGSFVEAARVHASERRADEIASTPASASEGEYQGRAAMGA